MQYQRLFGDMLVPLYFIIPWTDEWPEEMWDIRLGCSVIDIRRGNIYKDKKEELMAVGFDFSSQRRDNGWEKIKLAFETFKLLRGNLIVSWSFLVPSDSADWPESIWGIKLGRIFDSIKKRDVMLFITMNSVQWD